MLNHGSKHELSLLYPEKQYKELTKYYDTFTLLKFKLKRNRDDDSKKS